MNMSDEIATIELPVVKGKRWCLALDTSLRSPNDIIPPEKQRPLGKNFYSVNSKTVVALENTGFLNFFIPRVGLG
jgi:glycogen operon protein